LTESGRFRIDRATFDFLARPAPTIEALALSEAAEALWPTWLEQRSGRAAAHVGEHEFVSVWSPTPTGSVAVIGRLDGITGQAAAVAKTHAVNVALVDESGRVRSTWGAPIDDTGVTKGQRETNLPWVLRVSFADPESTNALLISRQRVMIGVFALMALMTAASTGLVFRAVRREVAVAQLQSDFLAAVSHEFRTPLAAMSHLTETLSEKRATPERVPEYYDALARETRRLHGLVESLLDFGRTEAGRRVYQRTEIDVSQIVLDVVNSTRNIATLPPDRIAVDIPGPPCRTFADRDAMALVVRNLLDNALKYSPPTSIVRIAVRSQGRHIAVVVEDAGAGISKSEQRLVFRKFVRGAAAADLDVKGTGIGLTMARHVVLAHGGRLTLASEAGRGSRFTVWLPALPVLRVESAIADHP
jgi:signal transduction histidine kinase